MAEAPLAINLKAIFTGKKAFQQADTAVNKLSRSASGMASNLGLAFGTAAVLAYGKAAMRAAANDQQAQAILSQNLKNLGLAYANVDSEGFIASLEKQTAILDDELRPAYAKLARVTGSIGKTQKIMKAAFDASKGSGQSYATVIETLSQAYVGNNKGLRKLNLGLTTAELSAMNFDEILQLVTSHFNGAGTEALKGYAGQMAKLNVASVNASETIGGALLDSFSALAGGGDIDAATGKIDLFSRAVSGLIRLSAVAINPSFTGVKELFGIGSKTARPAQSPGERLAIDKGAKTIRDRENTRGQALAKEKQKELAALRAKNIAAILEAKLKKDQVTIDEAKKKFDLERIGIMAALADATDAETKARLNLMLAILDENAAGVTKAGNNLVVIQDKAAASIKLLADSSVLAAGNLIAASMQVRAAADNPYKSVAGQFGTVTTNAFATAATNVGNGADAQFDLKWAAMLQAAVDKIAATNKPVVVKVDVKTDLPSVVAIVNEANLANSLFGNTSSSAGSLERRAI